MMHTETATQICGTCYGNYNTAERHDCTDPAQTGYAPADLTAHRVRLADGVTGIVIGAFGHPGDQALDINTDDGRMLDDVDSRDVTDLGHGSY